MITPINIDYDHLMLRIGRLTVMVEATAAQRDEAVGLAQSHRDRADAAEARVKELEALLDALTADDDESDETADGCDCCDLTVLDSSDH